jgi:hypothetical protein
MPFQVAGNDNASILISFASRSFNAGQLTSKLHVIELGAVPGHLLFSEIHISYVHHMKCNCVLVSFVCFYAVPKQVFVLGETKSMLL